MSQVEGSIYLFALINPEHQDFLMRLQSAIAAYVDSPGKVPFNKFRAFRSAVREAEEPFRFVDGELIERFLTCEPAVQEEIVGVVGGGAEVETVRGMIEALRRLH
jgi:DNA damage-binding protein 1